MRWLRGLLLTTLVGGLTAYTLSARSSSTPPVVAAEPGVAEHVGKTQPTWGRSALICPVPLHPVDAVLVKVGDRVKKGQVLVEIDHDEPEADVRAKEAILEGN